MALSLFLLLRLAGLLLDSYLSNENPPIQWLRWADVCEEIGCLGGLICSYCCFLAKKCSNYMLRCFPSA